MIRPSSEVGVHFATLLQQRPPTPERSEIALQLCSEKLTTNNEIAFEKKTQKYDCSST